jgi:hypothetical protein
MVPMRMLDDDKDQPVNRISLFLTEREVAHLLSSLQERLADPDPRWHMHIDDDGDKPWELTLAVYDPDDLSAVADDERMATFLRTGDWLQ